MIEEIKIDRLEELIHEMMIKIRDTHPTNSAEGNPIEIENAAAAPLVKCVTAITGYQSGTGTPSPDNVRPIVAYNSGEIVVRGKNLVNKNDFTNGYLDDNGVFVSNPGYVTTDYAEVSSGNNYSWSYHRNVVAANIYGMSICWYDENKTFISKNKRVDDTNIGNYSLTITAPNNAKYARCSATGTAYGENYQLELGSTATPYEPYIAPTTHTTTFPSAIYRGSEDCVNGTVTTEWAVIASYAGETLPGEWISDRDEYAPGTTPTTGAQVAYELATPTTAQVAVSNAPIKSLSGYNHIESTTGDMEIEYITESFQGIVDLIPDIKVNSSGEATATLSKLEVDGVIYGLPE